MKQRPTIILRITYIPLIERYQLTVLLFILNLELSLNSIFFFSSPRLITARTVFTTMLLVKNQ